MANVRRILTLLVLNVAIGHAAILVGTTGSGIISFSSRPGPNEWSTRSLPGTETTFLNAAALNAAVQTNHAADISIEVGDGSPGSVAAQNPLASWSSGSSSIWTRPAANSATLLMATLQNATGRDESTLSISYTLSQSAASPTEQSPAHQVLYSFSGHPGTWVNIPALSGGSTGYRSATVLLKSGLV